MRYELRAYYTMRAFEVQFPILRFVANLSGNKSYGKLYNTLPRQAVVDLLFSLRQTMRQGKKMVYTMFFLGLNLTQPSKAKRKLKPETFSKT